MNNNEIILIFGTSADPIHQGHVELVVDATKALIKRGWKVTEVVLLPVFRHHNINDSVKRSLTLTYDHRFAMCQIAAGEIRNLLGGLVSEVSVSDLERELVWKKNRPNFSAETIEVLRNHTEPEIELAFLIGADSFVGEEPAFERWYCWENLIEDAMLVVSPREGFDPNERFLQQLNKMGGSVVYLKEINVPDISSKEIRVRLKEGADPAALAAEGQLSPEIAAYLTEHDIANTWRQIDSQSPVLLVAEKITAEDNLETRIGKHLYQQKFAIGLAESCTGGLIGHRITNVPGSSDYFMGSVVSYAYQAKVNLLGVSWDTLQKHGAVSRATVLEMAKGACKAFKCDLGLSVCCVAGPGGATSDKPVGTSWVALSTPDDDRAYHFLLQGDRESVKEQLAQKALEILLEYLEECAALDAPAD